MVISLSLFLSGFIENYEDEVTENKRQLARRFFWKAVDMIIFYVQEKEGGTGRNRWDDIAITYARKYAVRLRTQINTHTQIQIYTKIKTGYQTIVRASVIQILKKVYKSWLPGSSPTTIAKIGSCTEMWAGPAFWKAWNSVAICNVFFAKQPKMPKSVMSSGTWVVTAV